MAPTAAASSVASVDTVEISTQTSPAPCPNADYQGPIFITDVGPTLLDGHFFHRPYTGAHSLLRGVADQGVPIVYLARNAQDVAALKQFPPGTVIGPPANPNVNDEFKVDALQNLRTQYPHARFFMLGNDRDDDAAVYQQAGSDIWLRNVDATQRLVPADFHGVIRDVYSPELVHNVLASLAQARQNPDAPALPAGPNPPVAEGRSHGGPVSVLKSVGHIAGAVVHHFAVQDRGGNDSVQYVSHQSDTSLLAMDADALGALGDHLIFTGGPAADVQLMRVLTAHGADAGHALAILHDMHHGMHQMDAATRAQVGSLLWTDRPAVPGQWDGFDAYLDSATGTVARNDSRVEPLINGQVAFPAMLDAIDHATGSINWSVYAFQSDETGWDVAHHLAEAADRQVQVRLLYDVAGSAVSNNRPSDPRIFDYLRQHGIQIVARQDGDLGTERTHRKLLVVDGRTGFIGGMNVGNEYRNEWHDVQARVTGPAVSDIQRLFVTQWEVEGGRLDDLTPFFPPLQAQAGGGPARIIGHGVRSDENIKAAYLRAIDTSQRTINIADPYFADQDVLDHLKAAAHRGVVVNLVFPLRNDEGLMQLWERAHYPEMLKAGLHVWEYTGREMAHDKVATFDGRVSTIGSSNLDQESTDANYEANVWSSDPRVAQDLDARLFGADMHQSVPVTHPHLGLVDHIKGGVLNRLEKHWL
ncbi:MAG TPA: phosphatidylserine/phosphatidylglycerophosphate/cardiolipin synthase family protein [Candidatus Xenobia bacterium]